MLRPLRPQRILQTKTLALLAVVGVVAGMAYASNKFAPLRVGKQWDGSFIVSTEQRIEGGTIPLPARPSDMALHPSGTYVAVLGQASVVLVSAQGVLAHSRVMLGSASSYRGAAWSPDGRRLFVSMAAGYVQELAFRNLRLEIGTRIDVKPAGVTANPRPGGMAITRDGSRLFVVAADRNTIAEIDLRTNRWIREYHVQNIPFEVRLSQDEKTLIVTNWGGRTAGAHEDRAHTGNAVIVVDPRGAAATGTVSLITRTTRKVRTINVGLHPSAIAVDGHLAYITNSASDSLTEINISAGRVTHTIPITWGRSRLLGSMPCALAIRNRTAYVCDGGDNAVCVVDLVGRRVRGFLPAGFYPLSIALDRTGVRAFVLNAKGNGSVRRSRRGLPGNVHDFQGTVSIVDLTTNLAAATSVVAQNDGWTRDRSALFPNLAVYHGAIKHVLYVIKENRTYDEVLGDMPQGNGDRHLCFLGERLTPNHHAIARQFTLFDNAYVTGTNSADGHQWCTQAMANDYLEHFYSGFRTYSFDGTCAMSLSNSGCLWDAALKKGLTVRDYGEFCDGRLAAFKPPIKSWLDLWNDRASGHPVIQVRSGTRIRSLRPFINPHVLCWPLLQSDQERADLFISEYTKFSRANIVPNLMLLTLPCDHTAGRNPGYPKPASMVADNDLALGRVVEAVSKCPQWKDTCIFVIEDDAQFGFDHVDGHRTIYFALSPYTRRGYVDHELCNTVSMVRSIELMLGIGPMNRFDALTPPIRDCFTNVRNLSAYSTTPNLVALDEMNLAPRFLQGRERAWTERSMALDWSGTDRPDPQTLNRVLWHSVCGVSAPCPSP